MRLYCNFQGNLSDIRIFMLRFGEDSTGFDDCVSYIVVKNTDKSSDCKWMNCFSYGGL